jgi:hypothetical protein
MRLFVQLCCVMLAFSTSACGKKKGSSPDTPTPPSSDAGPNNGPQGPQGPQGKTGEQGAPGIPGATLNYSVKDATGQVIGKTTWDHYVRFNDENTFSVQLSDGAIFPVNPKDGTFAGGVFCQYVSSDCTGPCLYSGLAGTRNKIIEGSAGLYWLNTAMPLSAKNYSSSWSVNVVTGSQCTVETSPVATMAVELPNLWSKPAGFTYPVPVPMDVSEITSGLDEFED